MCLIAKDLPKKCKKTIVVYKALEINDNYIETPFQCTEIISPVMIAKPVLSENNIKCINIGDEVYGGFIHSSQYSISSCFHMMVYIVKAYIPKGAYYIKGRDGDIASTKLILDPRDVL